MVFSVILTKKFASLILEIVRGVDSPIINLGFGDVVNTVAKWQFGSPKKVSRPCVKSTTFNARSFDFRSFGR